jgi:translation initiation factor 3 subunit M
MTLSLNHLYNSGREGAWKIALFEAMVKLAIAAKQNTILDQILQDLDRLFQLWHVAEAEKSRIHYSLHTLLAESDPWLSHVHMLKWLESFKSESDAAQHVDQLTAAITSALARSTVFQYQSIASSHAAAAVAKKNADLIKLAQIFTSGSYNDLIAFSKASPAVFAAPLSLEAATTKIRILTIVSLANKSAIIPYETIAKEIGVSVDDAESWVLDTISEGLLEAKLDHLSSSVFVTYAFRREFGNAQWKDLQDKLSKWMDNIQGMISVIRDARSHGKEGQHTALKHGLVGSSQ